MQRGHAAGCQHDAFAIAGVVERTHVYYLAAAVFSRNLLLVGEVTARAHEHGLGIHVDDIFTALTLDARGHAVLHENGGCRGIVKEFNAQSL